MLTNYYFTFEADSNLRRHDAARNPPAINHLYIARKSGSREPAEYSIARLQLAHSIGGRGEARILCRARARVHTHKHTRARQAISIPLTSGIRPDDPGRTRKEDERGGQLLLTGARTEMTSALACFAGYLNAVTALTCLLSARGVSDCIGISRGAPAQ